MVPTRSAERSKSCSRLVCCTQDPKGKAYYWHSETNKVQWAKPNAETPIQ